ncbi:MAG: arginine--tRNA ligase [Candidatus Pacebacteria bacterium]|jgi:arginyl-tRNA synthetase|nr:arginine--tRNA ligase [Candidatus Paceibacterota bacterium]
MSITNQLKTIIIELLTELGIENPSVSFEHPTELVHGDYSTNVAMVYAKELKKNPRVLAEEVKKYIQNQKPDTIENIEIAGPGFINFFLSKQFFVDSLKHIIREGDQFGSNQDGAGKKVLVEYSSPNIAKPFTVGHLRSTIIGDAVANLLAFSGYTVIRDNHLGDWGTQFGKLIVAIKKWGDFEAIKKSQTPIKELVDLYVKFHDEAEKDASLEDEGRAWFTKLEQGDSDARALWQMCVALSMQEFDRIYARLRVSAFDTALGESFFEDKMAAVLVDVKATNIAKESEGAYLIFFDEEKTKLPPLMLTKKDGSSLYALRDLAADRYRRETYGTDITIINEVGAEQSQYFRQIFEAEELLGYFPKSQRVHIGHGLYRFAEGKMSTRKGNVIWLDDILNEAEKRAGELNEATKTDVALAAIKFNDLKREAIKDIVFDWDEILNLHGDTGPYLQYAHARCVSVLEKARESLIEPVATDTLQQAGSVEKLVYRFPEIVSRATSEYAPHYIATYLIELAHAFSTYYAETKIVDPEDHLSPYKVGLTKAVKIVLKNGLSLLGIPTPEKM